jgi:protein-L-isoaspartate(D-aspartate) O-methyltransferase
MIQDQIRRRGVADERLLDALDRVPRERFVPRDARTYAYRDRALAIGSGQTISQPYMVAAMTEALELKGHERVLEVGTGSGYQAAVLAHMARDVYTIERHADLARQAGSVLHDLGLANVHQRVGDGSLGWPEEAPFHGIVVTAASPQAPPALLEQLDEDGGRLVIPVGDQSLQELVRITRTGTTYTSEDLMGCRFVPLVGEQGWKE